MKEQFVHTLTNSFMLWFDHFLLEKGEAFSNQTGIFYHSPDNFLDDAYVPFSSPYKQFVADSSILGAILPTGIAGDSHYIDYDNGRIVETGSNYTSNSVITGAFAVKDFNIYFTNETEDDLVVENKYELNSRIPTYDESGIAPYDQVVPAVFLSTATMKNEGLAFGGEESTTVRANAVVLSDDPYKLDGILSIFGDSHNEVFYPIPMSGHPMNEYGDLKNNSYSYTTLSNTYSSNKPFLVDNVTTSKLTDKARKSLANDLYVGFIDFDLKVHRFRFS
jgi:hypothetical protein